MREVTYIDNSLGRPRALLVLINSVHILEPVVFGILGCGLGFHTLLILLLFFTHFGIRIIIVDFAYCLSTTPTQHKIP